MSIQRSNQGLPPTAERVEQNAPPEVNEQIRRQAEAHYARAASSDIERIDERLRELDQEWDVERTLQTNYGIVTILGITLGALVARPWFLFSALASGFMVQHALQAWCPPVSLFRRWGYRTAREIDQECYALKALRGDFKGSEAKQPLKALDAASIR